MVAVIVSVCPSPLASLELELLTDVEESVDTTLPIATEYILTDVPTTEKK